MNILTDDGYNRNKIETFDHSKLAEKDTCNHNEIGKI